MTENGMDVDQGDHGDDYRFLVEYGINKKVAAELETIYKTEKLVHSELDERALDALKEFAAADAIQVLKQLTESNLEHVTNKSAFLCGQMKTFRQKSKAGAAGLAPKGPDEAKLKEILDRTGYSLDVTTGQRKYGGPPPGWDASQPGAGHEVFVGKIPKDVFEDEMIPLLEKCGQIWDLRLMMDPVTGFNRGYCFVTFCDKEGATEAVKQLEGYEIKKGKTLKANVSIANQRLFVGNIPKSKSKEEIIEEFSKKVECLIDCIIYRSAEKETQKNRGFAFLEFESHKAASNAKRKLSSGRVKVWNCDIIVDWADPQEEPTDGTMEKVKVLYVRNLTTEVTEEQMKEEFEKYGTVERVKKIKDYGFVHFEERESAVMAMEALHGTKLGKLEMDVSLAKPPSENKKKEQRRNNQNRMMMMQRGFYGYDDYWGPPQRFMGRGGRRPPMDYFYDDYGYEDYGGYDYYSYGPPPPHMARGRGRGGMPPHARGRGGGVPPMRGGPRGAPVAAARGMRGMPARGRAGPGMARGRGLPPSRGQQAVRGKRKAAPEATTAATGASQVKRRNTNNDWGAQPIAQQPLGSTGYGSGASGGSDAQWYQDSYGQNWG